jgi:hypothetical protein
MPYCIVLRNQRPHPLRHLLLHAFELLSRFVLLSLPRCRLVTDLVLRGVYRERGLVLHLESPRRQEGTKQRSERSSSHRIKVGRAPRSLRPQGPP